MTRRLVSFFTHLSLIVFLIAIGFWLRSYWIIDTQGLSTQSRDGYRYWQWVSYDGSVGLKVTDGWNEPSPDGGSISHRLIPTDTIAILFFPSHVAADHHLLGFRRIQGADRYWIGETPMPVPGQVVLIPYWLVVLCSVVLPVRWLAGVWRQRREE